MPRITVTQTREPQKQQRFDRFNVGDFLLVLRTGRLGIKISKMEIRFFQMSDETRFDANNHSICRHIPIGKVYGIPTAVDLKVTW